ncbi:DUF3761 domain-containing protein [Streptomyces sp. NPDC056738]|uniref:DUF3761 domain-containing protein n=1 Tax=Streptomyces sp. NPDC056738 TaxID=3345933 RepID=UPI0036B86686
MARDQRPGPTAEDGKNARLGCGIVLAALLVVGGCNALIDNDGDASSSSSSSSSVYDGSSGSGDEPDIVTVGDFVGMELQAAQDAAQGAGIYDLDSTDATGQGRMQLLDRNWTVCAQTPAAGDTMSTDDTLTFDTVKSSEGETCDDLAGADGTGDDYGEAGTADVSGAEDAYGDDSSSAAAGAASDDGDNSSGDGSGSSAGGSDASDGDPGDSRASTSSGGSQQAPAGATALCDDGTYSYSAHRRGTCSHHGGVADWLAGAPS